VDDVGEATIQPRDDERGRVYFKPRGWATLEGCAAHIGPTSLNFEEDHEENRTKGMKPTG